jgi:hypothetical protein
VSGPGGVAARWSVRRGVAGAVRVPDGSSATPRRRVRAWVIVIRRLGDFTSRPEMAGPSAAACGCGGTGSLTTAATVSIGVPFWNGGRPSTRAYRVPPRLQASEAGPAGAPPAILRGEVGR